MNEKNLNIILAVAMVLLLASAFLPLTNIRFVWLPYVFTAAAFLTVIVRILQRVIRRKQKFSLRLRRLFTLEFWSSICYMFAALFLFADPIHSTWLGFLTAGACVQVYASFMIDYQLKKEQKDLKTKKNGR